MNLKFKPAVEEELIIKDIVKNLGWDYIKTDQIRCVFSKNSKSNAIGRIWSTPRILSFAFGIKPLYVIELIEERYKRLSEEEKIKVLIHELLHIPKTFSGALSPHTKMGKTLNSKALDRYYREYITNR